MKDWLIPWLWWCPIFIVAGLISDTFVSGALAAIIAIVCDDIYRDIKGARSRN